MLGPSIEIDIAQFDYLYLIKIQILKIWADEITSQISGFYNPNWLTDNFFTKEDSGLIENSLSHLIFVIRPT